MTKYVWKDPGTKVRIMFGCAALIAVLVFIDGLLKGEILRALAGAVFAWPFLTFMIKGVPVPEEWARSVGRQMDNILSMRPGGTSRVFHWVIIALGVVIGLASFFGAYLLLTASLDTIESFLPTAARGIRRAAERDSEMSERMGFAVIFIFAGGAALFTAWKRAKE
ncbi:hypothetical protein [Usitatibacter palustris]|uniref:Uncharacterized protein n=1 Tax=Usitatibacter palustris TaxID=2732487 RepID=A0A6M4H5A4_9PROT|nr:hypothetical protein [Usitatibacter palustris]QJR14839.1 hypothetical protein DSM104440_01652 [Usitatibacter palustris]